MTDKIGQTGVAPHLGGEFQMGISSDAANDQINRASRESFPPQIEKKSRIRGLRESLVPLLKSELECLDHLDMQWHFAIAVPFT